VCGRHLGDLFCFVIDSLTQYNFVGLVSVICPVISCSIFCASQTPTPNPPPINDTTAVLLTSPKRLPFTCKVYMRERAFTPFSRFNFNLALWKRCFLIYFLKPIANGIFTATSPLRPLARSRARVSFSTFKLCIKLHLISM